MELSANKIFRTVAANPANYGEGNYSTYGEVRVEQVPGSGAYTTTLRSRVLPDADDNSVFEIQDGLADFFPWTDFNPYAVTGFSLITDNIVQAQFYKAESYGEPPANQTLSLVGTFKAINGGIPKEVDEDFFTEILPASKQFLTWSPLRKMVTQSQPELLHFFVYDEAITELNLKVKLYFTDGTHSTHTIDTQEDVSEEEVYRLPAGYTQLGLSVLAASKVVKKYELWLTDQADAIISEVRTYVVDQLSTPENRYWLFTNSLGMAEILRTEGKSALSVELQKESSSNFLPNGYSRTLGEVRNRVLGMTDTLEVSTGYLASKEEALWAKEILLSNRVYLLTVDQRIPYMIPTKSYQPYQDKNFKWFLRFSAVLAYNNTKYSRQ
jgi:hypothetical protein